MSLSTEFEDVKNKIDLANDRCKFILDGLRLMELEYIQSTGSQYIDTGIKGSSNISVELAAQGNINNSTGYFIGSTDGNETNRYGFRSYSDKRVYFYTASNGWPNYSLAIDAKHTYKTDTYRLYIDGTLRITANSSAFTSTHTMYLFANNDGGTIKDTLPAKLYYCKIWDGGTLVRDFIPVINSDGAACLYDKVSEIFFKNKGTGEFTAGPKL